MPKPVRTILIVVLIFIVALASVAASELLLINIWLAYLPTLVNEYFFWGCLLPLQLLVVGVATIVLSRAFRPAPTAFPAIYALLFFTIHLFELTMFFNPLEDRIQYGAAILIACGVWLPIWRTRYLSSKSN